MQDFPLLLKEHGFLGSQESNVNLSESVENSPSEAENVNSEKLKSVTKTEKKSFFCCAGSVTSSSPAEDSAAKRAQPSGQTTNKKIGFTTYDRWLCFTCVKNAIS